MRLPTALRAGRGAGSVRCHAGRHGSAFFICVGGVRSCAAADLSARPKGRWKRTLPHTTAMPWLTALRAGNGAGCVSCRIQVDFYGSPSGEDAYAAHRGGESFDVDHFVFMLTSPHV